MKTNRKKALIVSLLVSLCMLLVVVGATAVFSRYTIYKFSMVGMVIGDAIGFLIVFAIVYRFMTKPDVDDDHHENHNIY